MKTEQLLETVFRYKNAFSRSGDCDIRGWEGTYGVHATQQSGAYVHANGAGSFLLTTKPTGGAAAAWPGRNDKSVFSFTGYELLCYSRWVRSYDVRAQPSLGFLLASAATEAAP